MVYKQPRRGSSFGRLMCESDECENEARWIILYRDDVDTPLDHTWKDRAAVCDEHIECFPPGEYLRFKEV